MADFFIERNLPRDEKIVSIVSNSGGQNLWHAYSVGKIVLLANGCSQQVVAIQVVYVLMLVFRLLNYLLL